MHSAILNDTQVERVDSLVHPLALEIRQVLETSGHDFAPQLLIDDEENILQALRAKVSLERVFFVGEEEPSPRLRGALPKGTPVHEVATRTSKKLFEKEKASRLFALAKSPPPLKVDSLARLRGDIVVLEDLKIAGNIGAILRSSVALGAGAVILLGEDSPSLYDRRIVRASRGHVFSLPVLKTTHEAFLNFSRRHDIPLLVTSPHGGQNFHDIMKLPQRLAIVFGDEKSGCSETLLGAARFQVALPTTPLVESLNVSVTAGIVLYQRFVSSLN